MAGWRPWTPCGTAQQLADRTCWCCWRVPCFSRYNSDNLILGWGRFGFGASAAIFRELTTKGSTSWFKKTEPGKFAATKAAQTTDAA